jgi:hypothetical protein
MPNETFTINNESGMFLENLIEHSNKRNQVNSQINDMINLKFNEKENFFDLYDNIPKKLSLFKILKYRNEIRNFIIYQYSKKADTFVERKLLKDTKSYCCKYMNIYPIKNFSFLLICSIITTGHPLLLRYLIFVNSIWSYYFSNKLWWIKNNNTILLNFQMNSNYKLGLETKEFIYLIEKDLLNELKKIKENRENEINNNVKRNDIIKIDIEKAEINNKENGFIIIDKSKKNKILSEFIFQKNPLFYTKFFAKDIIDLKFEKEDEIVDYLDMNIDYDFHKEYLQKISHTNKMLSIEKDFMKLIR